MKKNGGFTLIEVLVALVIVGLALPALLLRTQAIIDHSSYINEKTYAYWFAENKMQEMQLTHRLEGNVTKTRKRQDTEEFAGQEWFWRVEMEETAVPRMFRMEVSVGLSEDEVIANLSGFLREKP